MIQRDVQAGLELPTRVVALDRDRGFWENETQVDVGDGWETLSTWAPPRASYPDQVTAFEHAVLFAVAHAAKFFPRWLERRSLRHALAEVAANEQRVLAAQHAAAAPTRRATIAAGEAELARRADEAAEAVEARLRVAELARGER